MTETSTLEKLRFEMQAVETEVKAKKKALKKLERETLAQIQQTERDMNWHTQLVNCQAEGYQKYVGALKETVEDVNAIITNLIAIKKGEAPDLTAELFEKLNLKLLQKIKNESASMMELNKENLAKSDQVPEFVQGIYDRYNHEKEANADFLKKAQDRIKQLELDINRIREEHE